MAWLGHSRRAAPRARLHYRPSRTREAACALQPSRSSASSFCPARQGGAATATPTSAGPAAIAHARQAEQGEGSGFVLELLAAAMLQSLGLVGTIAEEDAGPQDPESGDSEEEEVGPGNISCLGRGWAGPDWLVRGPVRIGSRWVGPRCVESGRVRSGCIALGRGRGLRAPV